MLTLPYLTLPCVYLLWQSSSNRLLVVGRRISLPAEVQRTPLELLLKTWPLHPLFSSSSCRISRCISTRLCKDIEIIAAAEEEEGHDKGNMDLWIDARELETVSVSVCLYHVCACTSVCLPSVVLCRPTYTFLFACWFALMYVCPFICMPACFINLYACINFTYVPVYLPVCPSAYPSCRSPFSM